MCKHRGAACRQDPAYDLRQRRPAVPDVAGFAGPQVFAESGPRVPDNPRVHEMFGEVRPADGISARDPKDIVDHVWQSSRSQPPGDDVGTFFPRPLLLPDAVTQGRTCRIDIEPDDVHTDVAPGCREFDSGNKARVRTPVADAVERCERIVIRYGQCVDAARRGVPE